MIIPVSSIPRYLHSIEFPVELRAEENDRILRHINRDELMALLKQCAVVGIGTWKRIRHFKVCESQVRPRVLKVFHQLPIAEDDRTVVREIICGATVFRHHPRRSGAYAR